MKYPIGIQDFEKIIEDGYVYLDKTGLVYDLVHNNLLSESSTTIWKVIARVYLEMLFRGKKGVVQGACHRQVGEGMEAISCVSSRLQW